MEFNNALYGRTSVRTFTDEPVSAAQIEALLRAAMAAPSAGNQQPWSFHVVQDPALCAALATASPYAKPAAKAPVAIVPCMHAATARHPTYVQQDLAAAVENLLLAATAEGLGAVWMGIAPEANRVAAVGKILRLPEDTEAFALIAVGHPAKEPQPKGAARYDESRVVWH